METDVSTMLPVRATVRYDVSGPYLIDLYPTMEDAIRWHDPFQWRARKPPSKECEGGCVEDSSGFNCFYCDRAL